MFLAGLLRRHALGVFVASAAIFAFAHRSLGYWSVDDAGITFAYSIGVGDRGSLSPLPEAMPVEGYSNPLLMVIAAGLRALGLFDPITTHVWIEAIAFGAMATLVFALLRARVSAPFAALATFVFVLLEVLTPSTWLWYRSGLENVVVSLTLVALLFLADRTIRTRSAPGLWIGGLAFLAAIVRPEAPLYVAAFYVAVVAWARPPDMALRRHMMLVARPWIVTAVLFVVFLLWRHHVYGAWLPNTYYAKLRGGTSLLANLDSNVLRGAFVHGNSLAFACAVPVLALLRHHRRTAALIALFVLASLTMSLVGGGDLLGEHRFATPFFAMVHVAIAVLLACALTWDHPRRHLRVLATSAPIVVFLVAFPLASQGVTVTDVTTARVAELQGAQRVEHQRRVGVICPVVIAPDAGGALLFGAMQHIDNGYLTDFPMAHMPRIMPFITQYQVEERRADLADTSPSWPFDRSLVGTRYLYHSQTHMFARRDLVEVGAVPTGIEPFYRDDTLALYLSPENVLYAGPHGLARVEIIVEWRRQVAPQMWLRVQSTFDRDELWLQPYTGLDRVPAAAGIQRRGLLVAAPPTAGTFEVRFDVGRDDRSIASGIAARITVLESSIPGAVAELFASGTPESRMRRMARLREQWPPRLGMTIVRRQRQGLREADQAREAVAGEFLRSLIWDARLAAFDDVPEPIRAAERRVVSDIFKAEPACTTALCLGRRVDGLRRQGYFGVLEEAPWVREQLAGYEQRLDELTPAERYATLVGLVLAEPRRVSLQKALLEARKAVGAKFPALD